MEVANLEGLSNVAHDRNVPLIADTTIIPFTAFHAADFGVDIEVVSSTKYISGGATSLGGLIIDYGRFDQYRAPALKALAGSAQSPFHTRLRKEVHRNLGAYMTPDVACMQTLGLETLQIRFDRQAVSCMDLALKLQTLSKVRMVNYNGLENNPFYEVSRKQFGDYPGAMLTFDLGSREECFAFMNKLKLIRRATNLFDNRSLIIHPASTIFGSFTAAQREMMNVEETTIRLSVGLENVEELFGDICQALG